MFVLLMTDNPKGYYEFEAVKRTKEDASWLEGSAGKAVKMVYRLLYDLPQDRTYRVLFMKRKLEEVLASQRTMLHRKGGVPDRISDEQMESLFRRELQSFYDWVPQQRHIEMNWRRLQQAFSDSLAELSRVTSFWAVSSTSRDGSVVDSASIGIEIAPPRWKYWSVRTRLRCSIDNR